MAKGHTKGARPGRQKSPASSLKEPYLTFKRDVFTRVARRHLTGTAVRGEQQPDRNPGRSSSAVCVSLCERASVSVFVRARVCWRETELARE